MRNPKEPRAGSTLRALLAAIGVFVLWPAVAWSQLDMQAAIEDLEDEFDRLLAARAAVGPADAAATAADVDIFKFMRDFRAYQDDIGRVRGTVTFGTTGDSTASQDQFKANAGIDLTVGSFPSQLRVRTRADVRNTDNELTDDVSTFLINFDHYFALKGQRQLREDCRSVDRPTRVRPGDLPACEKFKDGKDADERPSRFIESYAFVERFSDSFLSIDRRFEIGAGVQLEWHSRALNAKGEEDIHALGRLVTAQTAARAAFNRLSADPEAFDRFFPPTVLRTAETYARNRSSKWEAALAFSLFKESERPAEIVTSVLDAGGAIVPDQAGSDTRRLRPSAANLNRLTIRPSFVWRPLTEFSLNGQYYYKAALGGEARLAGVRDVRRDVYLTGEWNAGELASGRRAPTIGLTFEWHKDAVPPNLAAFASLPPPGGTLSRFSADKSHRQVRLEVKIDF